MYLNDDEVSKSLLSERLREVVVEHPERALVLKADREVSYGFFIEILDLAKQSGLKKISALTRPVETNP